MSKYQMSFIKMNNMNGKYCLVEKTMISFEMTFKCQQCKHHKQNGLECVVECLCFDLLFRFLLSIKAVKV